MMRRSFKFPVLFFEILLGRISRDLKEARLPLKIRTMKNSHLRYEGGGGLFNLGPSDYLADMLSSLLEIEVILFI
jgi:hypothetical protein